MNGVGWVNNVLFCFWSVKPSTPGPEFSTWTWEINLALDIILKAKGSFVILEIWENWVGRVEACGERGSHSVICRDPESTSKDSQSRHALWFSVIWFLGWFFSLFLVLVLVWSRKPLFREVSAQNEKGPKCVHYRLTALYLLPSFWEASVESAASGEFLDFQEKAQMWMVNVSRKENLKEDIKRFEPEFLTSR